MKADISAYTFRPDKHFAAVVVGQGQVLVDSAINEQEEIARHRLGVSASDVIGPGGVPEQVGGFEVTVAPDGKDLLLSPGRIYVDGILCENDPPLVGASVVSPTQLLVDTAAPSGRPFSPDQWVDVLASTTARTQIAAVAGQTVTLKTAVAGLAPGTRTAVRPVTSVRHQPDRFPFDPFGASDPAHVTANAYRVELDVWNRYLSPAEDPSIQEVALGDADAPSRLKVVWQARLALAGAVGGGSCAIDGAAAKGQLIASTVPGLPSDEPCVLPDEAGYRGLENQLYRVEVHSASATTVVLKWQRDNASTVSKVISLGSSLQLADMGRDDERGFATAAYVEVTDDALELEQQSGDLLKVTGPPDTTNRTVQLEASPTAAQPGRNPRARRWDGVITIDLTLPTAGQPVPLERGLQVALVPGALRPGDYWLIAARTANSAGGGTITWPRDDAGNALAQPPQGIRHHTAALALVDCSTTSFLSGTGNVRECRALFPPLTGIAASNVSVDPAPCGFTGVSTVQQAIDELCNRSGAGLCTAIATPGPGWEKVFDSVAAGADAQICFPVGTYPASKPVTVTGKGNLVLHGAGPGSRLVATGLETVLAFTSCSSVSVRSLTAQGDAGGQPGLNGILAFTDCGDVTVRDCLLTGVAQPDKKSACLGVTRGTLTVRDTRFEVGNRQIGVLAVDTVRTVVANSQFVAAAGGSASGPSALALTKLERELARRLLLSDLGKSPAAGTRVGVKIGASAMSFATTPAGKAAWPGLLQPSYPSMKEFQKAVDKLMHGVFTGHAVPGAASLSAFIKDRIIDRRMPVMAQAIVVAGQAVGDIQIEANQIDSAIQGVHIGASHQQPRSNPADITGRVVVAGNKIHVVVPPEGARARHAIFVGNADRLRVTGNDLSYTNLAEGDRLPTDGVRIYGFIGRAMTVRDNVVDSFPGGIRMMLLMARGPGQASLPRMWAVEDNLVIGLSPWITLSGPLKGVVKLRGNRPGPPDN